MKLISLILAFFLLQSAQADVFGQFGGGGSSGITATPCSAGQFFNGVTDNALTCAAPTTSYPLAAPQTAYNTAPPYSFAAATGDGMFYDVANGFYLGFRVGGFARAYINNNSFSTYLGVSIISDQKVVAGTLSSSPVYDIPTAIYGRFLWLNSTDDSGQYAGLGFNKASSGGFRVDEAYFKFYSDAAPYDAVPAWDTRFLWDGTAGVTTLKPKDNAVVSANSGIGITISGGDKTAGTGAGGALLLMGGAGFGGGGDGIVQLGKESTTPQHSLNTATAANTNCGGIATTCVKWTINGVTRYIPAF